jgi:hypothetical protein
MYYPRVSLKKIVVLLSICGAVVLGGIVLVALPSAAAANSSTGRSPVRLRLKVDNGTLRPGEGTGVHAEFLDVDYQQVPSDGTRMIEFAISGGSGTISPRQITVRPGGWSADVTFASAQPGKVVITARTAGLDAAQTMLVVIRPGASFLSELFSPVAYAAGYEGFQLFAAELTAPANNLARLPFKVAFSEALPEGTKIRISVTPPAVLIWGAHDQDRGSVTDITFPKNEAISNPIDIISGTPNDVDVKAQVLPNGPEQHLRVTFSPPHPARIVFGDSVPEMGPYKTEAMICVKLADLSSKPLVPDKPRNIILSSEDPVEFDPPTVELSPRKDFVETKIRLKGFPVTGQVTLLAKYPGVDDSLMSGEKVIVVRSVLDKVIVTGPAEVTTGGNAEFTVRLADKDGKPRKADWDRRINLSAATGTLSPAQVTIAQGQEMAKVRYLSGSSGKDTIKAESDMLADGSLQITLVTALYWLLIFALFGGLIGGIVRVIPAGDKVERLLPRWTGENWQLLIGRIVGSVVSGLFLYLSVRFGISQLMGSPSLPAALDLGTRLAAFFLGGIGGFAGTVVLDRLVGWFLPSPPQGAPKPA